MARPDVVERILLAVAQVPTGRVASYGDVAAVSGAGPRQVGQVLHRRGDGVPWWRVTRRDGGLDPRLLGQAHPHWVAEGIACTADGARALMARHRADPHQLAADYDTALAGWQAEHEEDA